MENSFNRQPETVHRFLVAVPDELFGRSMVACMVEGKSLGELMRGALLSYVEALSGDEDFRQRAVGAIALYNESTEALLRMRQGHEE